MTYKWRIYYIGYVEHFTVDLMRSHKVHVFFCFKKFKSCRVGEKNEKMTSKLRQVSNICLKFKLFTTKLELYFNHYTRTQFLLLN